MRDVVEATTCLEDPAEALLALYRQPLLDYLKAPRFGVPDAAVSIWSKFHFSSVSIPTLVANLLLKQELPVGLPQMRLELAEDGRPAHIWLPEGAEPLLSQDPLARFDYLFDDHCAPVVEALAMASGLSPKVFWSNLGYYVEFVGKICPQYSPVRGGWRTTVALSRQQDTF